MTAVRLHPGWREAVKAIVPMDVGTFISTEQIEQWFDAKQDSMSYRLQWCDMTQILRREHGICLTRVRVHDCGRPGYTVATDEEKVQIHNRRWKTRVLSGLQGLHETIDSIDPDELSSETRRKLEHDVLYAGRMRQMHVMASGRQVRAGRVRLMIEESSEDEPD